MLSGLLYGRSVQFFFLDFKILDFNQRENYSCLILWVRCDAFQNTKEAVFPSCFTCILKKGAEGH